MGLFLGEVDGSRSVDNALLKHQTIFTEVHRATIAFYVLSNDLSQDEEQVIATTAELPKLYGVYGQNKTCIGCRGREISRIARHPITSGPCALWIFDCEFSDEVDISERGNDLAPDEKYAEVRWESEILTEVVNTIGPDIYGPASIFQTTAYEPLYYERKFEVAVAHITQYEAGVFDPNVIFYFANALNIAEFQGYPTGTVKCRKITTSEEIIGMVLYSKVEYEIAFRIQVDQHGEYIRDAWVERVLNAGHYYINENEERVLYKPNGDPATVNLDAEGHMLRWDDIDNIIWKEIPAKWAYFDRLLPRLRLRSEDFPPLDPEPDPAEEP